MRSSRRSLRSRSLRSFEWDEDDSDFFFESFLLLLLLLLLLLVDLDLSDSVLLPDLDEEYSLSLCESLLLLDECDDDEDEDVEDFLSVSLL
jgi:hypothetical protein